jgi:pimeloyl-ACP methyl ester carboxylesterase
MARHFRPTVLFVVLFAGCNGCGRVPPPPPPAALPRIDFVGPKRESGPVIVFVHGLNGDGRETWTNSTTKAYWPSLAASDESFADATIAAYWYDTTLFDKSLGLDEHARQMTAVFKSENLLDRQFVFVCHSMGGLLVRRFLLMRPDVAENVQMLCFLSTPFAGSQLVDPAILLSSNPTIQDMLRSPDIHTWLDEQQSQWVESKLKNIPAYCGYEKVNLHGFRVVDENSAGRGANRQIMPFKADHIVLCKPASKDELVYKFLVNAYNETVPKLNSQRVKEWPTEETL